ncbi:MAG: hypothetical protein MJE77_37445 [Proteobacteria bacterium]|nr:hypothetical protein [Pseudomonadota bacterium]
MRTRINTAMLAALPLLVAGCSDFEVRSIVLDLRVLAMAADPPEIVVPFDADDLPDNPADVDVEDVEVCALVADPAHSRALEFTMRACSTTDTRRCDEPDRPVVTMGEGTITDPEQSAPPAPGAEDPDTRIACSMLRADLSLYNLLQDAVDNDSLSGFGGVEVMIEFTAYPPGETSAGAVWAAKRMLYAPKVPAERVANKNPSLAELRVSREDGEELVAPLGRCGDGGNDGQLTARIGELLTFEPIETEGSREDYVVPTFDGGSRMFTENHTYSWYATSGDWEREVTGGPRDFAGNEPPLDSEWTAPEDAAEVGDGLDVRFWVVQRDERGGLTWYETCLRVMP